MDASERAQLVRRYIEGPRLIVEALQGVTASQLDARPAPGEWSPREIVHHTADSEMMSAMRLRKLIAEEDSKIQAYDEAEFARVLFYDRRALEPSLLAIQAARATTAQILAELSDAQWARAGTHEEVGEYSVETWLRIYARHCHDHADQIARAARGEV